MTGLGWSASHEINISEISPSLANDATPARLIDYFWSPRRILVRRWPSYSVTSAALVHLRCLTLRLSMSQMSRRKRQQDRPKNVRYGTVRTDGRSSPSHQFTTTTEQGQDWKRELPGSSPGEGGHVAAIPPGTGSLVRANDPNRAGSGKREVGSGNSSKAGDLQGALSHTP